MKVAAIIPARYGASRFPGKPLALIAGEPMIARVVAGCLACEALDEVIVATDHANIAAVAKAAGATVIMTGEAASGTDRVAQAAAQRPDIDVVINVQGDEPLIAPGVVAATIEPFVDDETVCVTTAARPFWPGEDQHDPNRVKVILNARGDGIYFSRSAIPYQREPGTQSLLHIGIYGYRRATLLQYAAWAPTALEKTEQLEQLRLVYHGVPIRVATVDWRGIAVDNPSDIALVEEQLKTGTLS